MRWKLNKFYHEKLPTIALYLLSIGLVISGILDMLEDYPINSFFFGAWMFTCGILFFLVKKYRL